MENTQFLSVCLFSSPRVVVRGLTIIWISIPRYVKETAAQIVSEQSPRKLSEIRSRLYELIVHCIPPEVNIQCNVAF